jgi:hypothetical protein
MCSRFLLGIALIQNNLRGTFLKLFAPAVQHGTGDTKFSPDLLLSGITLHAFQHDFQLHFR